MTKLLCITTGNYVVFPSSYRYDREHSIVGTLLEEFTESFAYEDCHRSIESELRYILNIWPSYKGYTKEEFEIIYD